MTNEELNAIIDEFRPKTELLFTEDEQAFSVQEKIFNELSESDRRIILFYAEFGSVRKVADLLHLSTTTVFNHIKKIKLKLSETQL